MTEPTDALLPCPFCGEAAKHSFNSLYGDMSMASCKSCGATAYAPKWNRRAVLAKWGQPAQAADSVQEDAALWRWLAEYLVGTRTDLDDEIVASETVNDLRKLVKAAIKQGEKQ